MPEEKTQSAAGPTGSWVDPYRAYNFRLEIQGVTEGHFARCTGLGAKVHTIRYREAGNAQVVHCLPGPVEYPDVTLRYGLTKSLDLWNWFLTSVRGKVERRNVSVVMLDADGVTEVIRYNLLNAWLSEWQGAPLDTMEREVAIESLTLVFETLERA